MEKVKINSLQIENTKRVKAVTLEPTANGLTILGGKNEQGKTSVLDSISWALGGNKYRPSTPWHEGSVIPPFINITLSNGLKVERKGKNSDLKVTDPQGNKSGQNLLDSFISQFALDLPKFMEASNSEKAKILLKLLGVESELVKLDMKETEIYNNRHAIGQIATQKEKHVEEMPYFPDAPEEPVSALELIKAQQEILAKNGENERKRQNLHIIKGNLKAKENEVSELQQKKADIERLLATKQSEISILREDISMSEKTVEQLQDENTAEIEAKLTEIEDINRQVNVNRDKEKASEEANEYAAKYQDLTEKLDNVRKEKVALLKNAQLPLPELGILDGDLTYKDKKWDCMSGSERMKVAIAITKQLQPNCGFVLMDKLEQFDNEQLIALGDYLKQEGLQVIATRVSTGKECTIIIEDGIGGDMDMLEDMKVYKNEPQYDIAVGGDF